MSEEKFSKCGEGKKSKCKISGVRKKRKLKGVLGKKKKIFLSSCSLVGLYVD